MTRLDVSSLIYAQAGSSLHYALDVGPQELIDLTVDFVRGKLEMTREPGCILVQGSVQCQLSLECVRCLEPFLYCTALDLKEVFRVPGAGFKPGTPYSVSNDGWLELAPLLREQIWLEIPLKPLCCTDCGGLCPQCGASLNLEQCACESTEVDPRLAVLKNLL